MSLLIIDNFDSFTYNLYQYCAQLGVVADVIKNNELSFNEIEARNYSHIIISPGPGSPEIPADFGVCSEVIQKSKSSILGVCLGHQGIVYALGGSVIRAPKPMHGKTSMVELDTHSPLFKEMPKEIEVMRYHSLIADEKSLPATLNVIARTTGDAIIMGVQHKTRPLFGVQFHPESIGTPHGISILKNFLSV